MRVRHASIPIRLCWWIALFVTSTYLGCLLATIIWGIVVEDEINELTFRFAAMASAMFGWAGVLLLTSFHKFLEAEGVRGSYLLDILFGSFAGGIMLLVPSMWSPDPASSFLVGAGYGGTTALVWVVLHYALFGPPEPIISYEKGCGGKR